MDIDESIVHEREIKATRDRISQAGIELRAGIDTETVRGLQLINGGMAAGLVTMLPTIVRDPGYESLGRSMLFAIACAAAGLISATVHNHFRRQCSHAHDSGKGKDNPYTCKLLVMCQSSAGETRVCTRSNMAMWISMMMFFIGAMSVGYGFLQVRATAAEPSAACWELQRINDHMYKFNRCTGRAESYTEK